jgi:hypothetical protein
MLAAVYAAYQGADAVSGGGLSSWFGSVLGGGGASSDAEKAARALSGDYIQPGPYTPEMVRGAIQAGGNTEFQKLVKAVELKDFMRPGSKTWPGPWTPDLVSTAAVYFAHGAVDGVLKKNEIKIRDAVAALLARFGGVADSGPITVTPPYGGGYSDPSATNTTPNWDYPAPQTLPYTPPAQASGDTPVYLYGLGALLVVIVFVFATKGR